LVIDGLIDFSSGNLLFGLAKIAIGRIMDIYDGYIAEFTKTKSLAGAIFDYTADMLLLAISLVTLVNLEVLPLSAALLIAVPKAINVLSWVGAVMRKTPTYVLGISKIATFIIWFGIVMFLFDEVIEGYVSPGFESLSWFVLLIGVGLAIPASFQYARIGLFGHIPKSKPKTKKPKARTKKRKPHKSKS